LKPVTLDSADVYPSSDALLPRLAVRAAHDLNNLIAVISGNAYLLRQSPGADAESLHAIGEAVAGLERLSRSLSALGAAQGPTGSADVAQLARATAGEAWNARIELDLPEDLPRVAASEGALRAALRALLSNAAQAAPGGVVRLAARRDDSDGVVLSVEDLGPGMTPEAAGRAFDPFFSTRGGGRGTGIGLFLAAAVASAHGAACRVAPREGGGTRASIRLRTARA